MKRILIFTVTAGSGHNTISKNIKDAIIKSYGNLAEVEVIDLYKHYNCKLRYFICDKAYRFTVNYFRGCYNTVFKLKQKNKPVKRLGLDAKFMLLGLKKKMEKSIKEYNPQFIVCSHFFPAIALSELKANNCESVKDIPIALIVSDYVICPYIEQTTHIDYVFTFTNALKSKLNCIGFNDNQIKVFAPPCKIEWQGFKSGEKGKNERLTLVAMTGDGKFSGLVKNIKNVINADVNAKLILVNGKNEKQKTFFDKLIAKQNKKDNLKNLQIENYGFVSDELFKDLLANSDAVITKCGLNSIMEVLNSGKLLITTNKLAEQERQNVLYFKSFIPILLINENSADCLTRFINGNVLTTKYVEDYGVKLNRILKRDANKQYADFIFAHCANFEN